MLEKITIYKAWRKYRWGTLILLSLVTYALGCIGFKEFLSETGQKYTWFDIAYLSLQLFFLESGYQTGKIPLTLEISRFMASIITISALLETLAAVFHEQLLEFRVGMLSKHIVISGLNESSLSIARGFRTMRKKVVILAQSLDNNLIPQCENLGIKIIQGSGTSIETLHRVKADKAHIVIALETEDGANAEMAVHCCELVRNKRKDALTCYTHIEDPHLVYLLREREILTEDTDAFRLQFFNVSDLNVRLLLGKYPAVNMIENCVAESLLIVGFGRIGQGVLIRFAHRIYSMNSESKQKSKILIIDRAAQDKWMRISCMYPRINNCCEVITLDMDIASAEFYQANFFKRAKQQKILISRAYVCLSKESDSLSCALILHQKFRDQKTQIVINMKNKRGIGRILSGIDRRRDDNLKIFSLEEEVSSPDILLKSTHEILACAIHEEYSRELLRNNKNAIVTSWNDLSEELKEANRLQADSYGKKLESVSCIIIPITDWEEDLFEFSNDELEMLSQGEHERWMHSKIEQGWRHGAQGKDMERKLHPMLVNWEFLTNEQKEMNRQAIKVIPKILASVGLGVIRSRTKGRVTDNESV